MGALWPAAASSGGAVTTASGMTVNVAAGQVSVPAANGTGALLCSWDATEQATLAVAPASGSNRYDLVIVQARGNDLDGGANNDFLITTVTGTAAATPAVPAVPSNAVALAQVYVPGASASVTAGNITDRRPGNLAVPVLGSSGTAKVDQLLGYVTRNTNAGPPGPAATPLGGFALTITVPAG